VAKRSIPSNAPDRNSPLVIYRTADRHGPQGRDTRCVSEIVDPTPIVEERIAAEVGPLRAELSNAAEPKERKRIQREIRRREKRIRREVLGARAHW
jgi:hypothetical protein